MGEWFVWRSYRTPLWHYRAEWAFWFRLFGRGLHFSNQAKRDALFSERYGYRKAWYVLGIRIAYLPLPEQPQ